MCNAVIVVCYALEPYRDLMELILGSLITLAVAMYYFRLQLHIELMIRSAKLTLAYKRYFLSNLKRREKDTFPDYVKDAMVEYKGYFDAYLPEGDIASAYKKAAELARKEIQEHPEKFDLDEP